MAGKGNTSHGKRYTRAYQSWADMKTRILNPNCKDYKYYKDKSIDESWLDFENFYRGMGERPEGLTLERIDNLKGYCKENCCWATRKTQANNKRHRSVRQKLTEYDVKQIRKQLTERSLRQLAKMYKVQCTAIFNIKHCISWKGVA